jgi:hypothetical protein
MNTNSSKSIFNNRRVFQYSSKGEFIGCFLCINQASQSTLVHPSSILNCCKKRNKLGGGFKWKFASSDLRVFDIKNFIKLRGYENYYINPNGDVYNMSIRKFLKTRKTFNNYNVVTLNYDNEPSYHMVDYLVAYHFIPRDYESDKKYINHIDGDNSNDHIDNLEWIEEL